jgi:hypothetical protein
MRTRCGDSSSTEATGGTDGRLLCAPARRAQSRHRPEWSSGGGNSPFLPPPREPVANLAATPLPWRRRAPLGAAAPLASPRTAPPPCSRRPRWLACASVFAPPRTTAASALPRSSDGGFDERSRGGARRRPAATLFLLARAKGSWEVCAVGTHAAGSLHSFALGLLLSFAQRTYLQMVTGLLPETVLECFL